MAERVRRLGTGGTGVRRRPTLQPYEHAHVDGRPLLREACGVVGIHSRDGDVANQTYFALFAVQHRGQESAGIAVGNGSDLREHGAMGLVSRVFSEQDLAGLQGHVAVGHCRYSTTGSSSARNIQPILRRPLAPLMPDGCDGLADLGPLAVAHNGNIVNALDLRMEVDHVHARRATSDTGIAVELLAHDGGRDVVDRLVRLVPRLRGSFSLVLATPGQLIGVRDGLGNRPLSLARLGDGWMLASETAAFDSVGARFVREVEPGEIVIIDDDGVRSIRLPLPQRPALCAFEYIYFQRPDSRLEGRLVHSVRREMGRRLALQRPTDADLVIGVPDSAIAAATGFAEAARLPYADGFVRNRYIGRTFIEPTQNLRRLGARLKYNPLPEVVRGKRIVLLDDTIVRGTTQQQLVGMLRDIGGAREVHVRITAPPIRWPCFLGIDIPDPGELIAHGADVEDVRRLIGADSLEYLSVENLVAAIGSQTQRLCLGCFTRDYPIEVQLPLDKLALERSAGLETAEVFPRDGAVAGQPVGERPGEQAERFVPAKTAPGEAAADDAVSGRAVPGLGLPSDALSGEAVPGLGLPSDALSGEAVPGLGLPSDALSEEATHEPQAVAAEVAS
jgi:amidophosphoribosyltransferase